MREHDYRKHREIKYFIFADEWSILETLPKEYGGVMEGSALAGCVQVSEKNWIYLVYNPYQRKFNLEVVGSESNQQVQEVVEKIQQHFSAIKFVKTSFEEVLTDVAGYKHEAEITKS